MNHKILYLIPMLFLGISQLAGQTGEAEPYSYPGGIAFRYGSSFLAMRDRYISPERYTGRFPYLALGWTRVHQKYVYRLDFHFQNSREIKNNRVTSDVLKFKLSQGFVYPLKPIPLFNRQLSLWIGPTADISYFENKPDIAVTGFDYTNSYATMISAGFRGDGIYPLSAKVALETSLQLTILTLGVRTVDREENDQPGARLLYPANGLNAAYELGMRYELINWLSVGLSYRYDLIRITAWEEILAAAHGAFLELRFNF